MLSLRMVVRPEARALFIPASSQRRSRSPRIVSGLHLRTATLDLAIRSLPWHEAHRRANGLRPAYTAEDPSSEPIRKSWLYFATRSERERLPVLICPAFVATARSAMNESSVSPDRWLM